MLLRFFLLAVCFLFPGRLFSENWPQFRGPAGTNVADTGTESIPSEWSATKNLIWKTPLVGKGSSSPVIWGERIFVTSYSGYGESKESPGDRSNLKRHLICLNKANGEKIWAKTLPSKHQVSGYANFVAHHGYASHTPVTDGKAVYAYFAKEGVYAFDMDGEELWRNSDVGDGSGGYGSGGALTLSGDLLFVNASAESKSIIALSRKSGEEVWRKNGIEECYNTPTVFGGTLLANAKDQLVGLDPLTGEQKWTVKTPANYVCNSPTVVGEVAYVIRGGRGPTIAIKPDGSQIWSAGRGVTVPSPAVTKGLVFIPERDILTCLNADTGAEVFRERTGVSITDRTYASPLVLDDRVFVSTRLDGVIVFAAKSSFELLAHNKIEGDDSLWNASPAVSGGRLFLRSEEALYCVGN